MVVKETTECGEDFPIPCEPRGPIVTESTASSLQSSLATHLPIQPSPSLTPSQPMALAYPALQLFYLLPGNQPGSPPALLPVYSSLPHGQPLFLPALTCGAAQQQTNLEETDRLQKSQSEEKIAKEEPCVGNQVRFQKSRGEFFRPWENACTVTVVSKPKPKGAECPKFRPWEEASPPTLLHKNADEGKCVTDMMKGMVIGQ